MDEIKQTNLGHWPISISSTFSHMVHWQCDLLLLSTRSTKSTLSLFNQLGRELRYFWGGGETAILRPTEAVGDSQGLRRHSGSDQSIAPVTFKDFMSPSGRPMLSQIYRSASPIPLLTRFQKRLMLSPLIFQGAE